MIHRNIERSFKAVKDLEFEIGDRVICRNPEYRSFSQKPVARDPFRPVNIVATVIEVLPGSMYKVRCDDDAEVIEKALFKGEMVRFVEKEDAGAITDDSTMKKPATRMDVFNAISETGLQTRRFYYGDGSHVKFNTRSLHVQLQLIKDYETVLDCGALATLYSAFDKEMSDALRGMYKNGIFSLMEKKFAFFLYGSVLWERKRRRLLGEYFTYFLSKYGAGSSHSCVECFLAEDPCNHSCCKEKAKDFFYRCGLQFKSIKNVGAKVKPKKTKRGRLPNVKDSQGKSLGSNKRKTSQTLKKDPGMKRKCTTKAPARKRKNASLEDESPSRKRRKRIEDDDVTIETSIEGAAERNQEFEHIATDENDNCYKAKELKIPGE